MQCMFSDYNIITISQWDRKSRKYPFMCKLNNTVINNPWDKEEMTKGNRNTLWLSENKTLCD